ncbi:hypothetical protein AQUCO_04300117v1 [Aquilegia coerulea]|uniref:Uncharacterized protein n=1 Tax=Aquilegia coerulea TaxID=218851 RepID=A0A2G5CNS1_AQUCA|nr:hypothetical protein AQUCO_04300117v1 [Aquilegia coerulea]
MEFSFEKQGMGLGIASGDRNGLCYAGPGSFCSCRSVGVERWGVHGIFSVVSFYDTLVDKYNIIQAELVPFAPMVVWHLALPLKIRIFFVVCLLGEVADFG